MKKLFLIFICCFSSLFAENQIILDGSSLNRVLNPFSFLAKTSLVNIVPIQKQISVSVEHNLSSDALYPIKIPDSYVIYNSDIEKILEIYLNDNSSFLAKNVSIELISAHIDIFFNEFFDEKFASLSDVVLTTKFKIYIDGVSSIIDYSINKNFGNKPDAIQLTLLAQEIFASLKLSDVIQQEFEYSIFLILNKKD